MNKEECLKAKEILRMANDYPTSEYNDSRLINDAINLFENLIAEHFDNPPLKPEELKKGVWVWDNKSKTYHFVRGIHKTLDKILFIRASRSSSKIDPYYVDVEENRFYRKQVE